METFRVGIDFRGAQSGGGSGQRGIGRYTTELVLGLLEYGRPYLQQQTGKLVEIVLFHAEGVPIPAEINGLVTTAPVKAPTWSDGKKPLWLRLPKIRSQKRFHEMRFNNSVKSQKREMERQLAKVKLDVLHIPSALDVGSYPIYSYPCPVVMTFLDAIVVELREDVLDSYPWFLQDYYFLQAKNLESADRIVAISEASKSDASRVFGLAEDKINVVYPAVSKVYDHPPEPSLRSRPYFLFCSVPDPHKNPRRVMEAFSRMPDSHDLVFISPHDQLYMPSLMAYAQELGIHKRFFMTGFIPERELINLFQNAEALVSPSKMEGFGLPVAQALRAGIPVITSNVSAQAEIAEGVGLLVDPYSVDQIAHAMSSILSNYDRDLARQLGRQRACWFDAEKVTRELADVYLSVARK
ncbi:MAG: glycosyltransferase family 1 protein [Armatimonadota bacterium]